MLCTYAALNRLKSYAKKIHELLSLEFENDFQIFSKVVSVCGRCFEIQNRAMFDQEKRNAFSACLILHIKLSN